MRHDAHWGSTAQSGYLQWLPLLTEAMRRAEDHVLCCLQAAAASEQERADAAEARAAQACDGAGELERSLAAWMLRAAHAEVQFTPGEESFTMHVRQCLPDERGDMHAAHAQTLHTTIQLTSSSCAASQPALVPICVDHHLLPSREHVDIRIRACSDQRLGA